MAKFLDPSEVFDDDGFCQAFPDELLHSWRRWNGKERNMFTKEALGFNFDMLVVCLRNQDKDTLERFHFGYYKLMISGWAHDEGLLRQGQYIATAEHLSERWAAWTEIERDMFECLCVMWDLDISVKPLVTPKGKTLPPSMFTFKKLNPTNP